MRPASEAWVSSAQDHPDFPIQNLPFGVFCPLAGAPRGGVAIGDEILDLRALHGAGLLDGEAKAACQACAGPTLNPFLALGSGPRRALRQSLSRLLAEDASARPEPLHRVADCILYMPAQVGDYTDFYVGIHHATNIGKLFRPDNPLLPNYKWVPIGYHGRASSLRVSGAGVRRPSGQRKYVERAEPSVEWPNSWLFTAAAIPALMSGLMVACLSIWNAAGAPVHESSDVSLAIH